MGNCLFLRRGAPPSSGPPKGKTLNEYTWEEIDYISSNGLASEYGFAVGDEKNITLSTNEALTLAIMDFDHDDLADGTGKAGITFATKDLITETGWMNKTNTNVGGWTGSEMYNWLQNTFMPTLPTDLQPVLKIVNKKTSAGNRSSVINTNAMKLFFFSEIEIFGTVTYSAPGEGEQYSYFATAANRIKSLSNGSGAVYNWWTRSPSIKFTGEFCRVNTAGGTGSYGAKSSWGVCFGFCV